MRLFEFLRLFVKSDIPGAPKSASLLYPSGLTVRLNLNMGPLYLRIMKLSSPFLIFFKKIFNALLKYGYNRYLDFFPANRFLIIPDLIENKTHSAGDDLQWRSCHCQKVNISKRERRHQPLVWGALPLFITASFTSPVNVNTEKSQFDLFCVAEMHSRNKLTVAKPKEVDFNGFKNKLKSGAIK